MIISIIFYLHNYGLAPVVLHNDTTSLFKSLFFFITERLQQSQKKGQDETGPGREIFGTSGSGRERNGKSRPTLVYRTQITLNLIKNFARLIEVKL